MLPFTLGVGRRAALMRYSLRLLSYKFDMI